MTREIKFRAWDKFKNEMVQNVTVLAPVYGPSAESRYTGGEIYISQKSDYNIMQYTGLKDKNGKEIYELDIIKTIYKNGYSLSEVCFGDYDNGIHYDGEESGNGWYVKERSTIWKDISIQAFRQTIGEIIGNIYENPELLKEQV